MIIFLAHSRVWRSYNPQNLRAISVWRAGDENYSPISLRSFCFLTAERFCTKIEHDIPHVKIFFFFKHKWWAPCVSIFGTIFNLIRVHVKYHAFEHLEMDLEKWARFSIATFVWSFLSIRRKMSKRWWLQLRWDDEWQLVHERFSK